MESISFYDSSGKVTSTISGDANYISFCKESIDAPYVDGDLYGKAVYINNGAVFDRPEMPIKIVGMVLENVPYPAKLFINDSEYLVEEGTIELTLPYPGIYKIKIECWPYLDKEFEIENSS